MSTTDTTVGTDDLKAVLILGAQIEKTISSDLADGKISLAEVFALLPYLMQIPDLITKKDAIISQAKSLSLDQVSALVAAIGGSVTDQNVIGTIEDVINLIVSIKAVIVRFTTKKA